MHSEKQLSMATHGSGDQAPPSPRPRLPGWALAVGITVAVTATCSGNTINCNCGGRQTVGVSVTS